MVHRSEIVGDCSLDVLGLLDKVRCRLPLKASQPVKEIHQHFQSFVLAGFHLLAHLRLPLLPLRIIFELEVIFLERDGVVDPEFTNVFETTRESIVAKIPRKGARNIREHEGDLVGKGIG